MSSEDRPSDGESWLPFLIRKKRFLEAVVLAWQVVEDFVDQMTIQEFELLVGPEGNDPRVDMIRDVPFGKKVDLLKTMARLSAPDKAKILEFSKERNRLFHGGVFTNPQPLTLPANERERLMKLADEASRIVANRVVGVWWQAETNDLTNKDIPRPEKPPAVKWLAEQKKRWAGTARDTLQ